MNTNSKDYFGMTPDQFTDLFGQFGEKRVREKLRATITETELNIFETSGWDKGKDLVIDDVRTFGGLGRPDPLAIVSSGVSSDPRNLGGIPNAVVAFDFLNEEHKPGEKPGNAYHYVVAPHPTAGNTFCVFQAGESYTPHDFDIENIDYKNLSGGDDHK